MDSSELLLSGLQARGHGRQLTDWPRFLEPQGGSGAGRELWPRFRREGPSGSSCVPPKLLGVSFSVPREGRVSWGVSGTPLESSIL